MSKILDKFNRSKYEMTVKEFKTFYKIIEILEEKGFQINGDSDFEVSIPKRYESLLDPENANNKLIYMLEFDATEASFKYYHDINLRRKVSVTGKNLQESMVFYISEDDYVDLLLSKNSENTLVEFVKNTTDRTLELLDNLVQLNKKYSIGSL